MDVVYAPAHRGRFFEVLQQTERSQTAVMTIAPGEDGGPEEEHAGDQILYVSRVKRSCASPTRSTVRWPDRWS